MESFYLQSQTIKWQINLICCIQFSNWFDRQVPFYDALHETASMDGSSLLIYGHFHAGNEWPFENSIFWNVKLVDLIDIYCTQCTHCLPHHICFCLCFMLCESVSFLSFSLHTPFRTYVHPWNVWFQHLIVFGNSFTLKCVENILCALFPSFRAHAHATIAAISFYSLGFSG